MSIKWSFCDNEKPLLSVNVLTPEEDKRIRDAVLSFVPILFVSDKSNQFYVNLHQCSLSVRQELPEEPTPEPKAIEPDAIN